MPTIPKPYELAKEFCRVLSGWLTPIQLAEVVLLNSNEADPSICHSHDHCDANMAMHEAACKWSDPLNSVTLESAEGPMSAEWAACWNAAWDMAKRSGFRLHEPLRKGEAIRIVPEWQDAGDAALAWQVYEDEMDGRVGICSPRPELRLQPWQMVDSYMVERVV